MLSLLFKSGATMKTAQARRAARRLTPYQAAGKVRLAGCAAGPRDLAENRRKYLRTASRAKHPAITQLSAVE
jgi:hypothetical protein